MAGRYNNWRHQRGAASNRPDLTKVGEKLLGYLAEQRALNGVTTQKITRTMPDGSVVTAEFVGNQPRITIQTKLTSSGSQDHGLLDGLIVRPSPEGVSQDTNPDKNHVLLRPLDFDPEDAEAEQWRPHFFNPAAVPVGFTLTRGFYGEVPGQPLLFQEGIGRYGNIDWRNADETVMVTFHGPESRYFYEAAASFGSKVYFKGSLLLDLTTVELALVGATGGKVIGACLRTVAELGPCLLVVARHAGNERLLRFRAKATAAARVAAQGLGVVPWSEALSLTLVEDSGEVLQTWVPDGLGAVNHHPWMFNQSGTEARRMSPDAGVSVEEVLTLDDEHELYEYSSTEHPWAAGTRTTQIDYTAVPTPADVTASDSSVNYYRAAVTTASDLDTVIAYTEAITDSYLDAWVPYAVDFRDDVPVYAYLRRATETVATTFDRPLLYTRTETGTTAYPLHLVCETDASNTMTASRTTTKICGGLRTDWMEHIAGASVSTIDHYEACAETSTITYDDLAAPGDPANVTITAASGTLDYTYERSTVTRTPRFVIGYVDLRYRMALYGRHTELLSRARTASNSIDLSSTLSAADRIGSSGYGVPLLDAGYVTSALTAYLTAELNVNDTVVWSIAERQLTGTDSTPVLQADLFAHNAVNGYQGNLVRGLSVGREDGGSYPAGDFLLWVAGTTPPGSTASYDDTTLDTDALIGGFDDAALMMREAAIAGDNSVQTNDYPDTVNNLRFGAWQAYKGRFGYSMTISGASGATNVTGLGELATGAASNTTMALLTGSEEPRFHPVGVLTPTAIPRRS